MEGIMGNLWITVKHNCMCLTLAVVKAKFHTLFSPKKKDKGSVSKTGLRNSVHLGDFLFTICNGYC